MYKWQQVKALRAKGESIKAIARRLKLSKNTVRKYLRKSGPPEFKGRRYERLLDGYYQVIVEMLGKGYIGTRIYNELLGMGYRGSLSTVHRYIVRMREQEEIRGKVTTRVETSAGRQMMRDVEIERLEAESANILKKLEKIELEKMLEEIKCFKEILS